MKILLADDHAVVREGLSGIISKSSRHTVVAEVADGLNALEQARLLKPDLVILDIGIPNLNGIEAIRQIRLMDKKIKILVLSVHRNRRLVAASIREGAAGYLVKDDAVDELVSAIEAVLSGRRYISPSLSDILAEELAAPTPLRAPGGMERLSSRERQVLNLIACGNSRAEIAVKLHISLETVKSHRKNIMAKLDIHTHSELVKFALDHEMGPI